MGMIRKITSFVVSFIAVFFLLLLISSATSQKTCAYDQGDTCKSGDICYTDTPGPDQAPGYVCGGNGRHADSSGTVSTYVYSADNGSDFSTGQAIAGFVRHCHTGNTALPHAPAGLCCTPGTPLPPLPNHSGYDLAASHDFGVKTCTNALSICYTGSYKNPLPGQQCGGLVGWHYGGTGKSVPSCSPVGIGNAVCCDVGLPTISSIPPNPCPSQNGVCTSIDTALGTIQVDSATAFIKAAFGVMLSLAGGVAVLLIIFSGYRIMTSSGDPEKIKGAREMLTSAIVGLLFVIFSVSILQIIGVDILHIPGFGK